MEAVATSSSGPAAETDTVSPHLIPRPIRAISLVASADFSPFECE